VLDLDKMERTNYKILTKTLLLSFVFNPNIRNHFEQMRMTILGDLLLKGK